MSCGALASCVVGTVRTISQKLELVFEGWLRLESEFQKVLIEILGAFVRHFWSLGILHHSTALGRASNVL